jgi:hypothetical protein
MYQANFVVLDIAVLERQGLLLPELLQGLEGQYIQG